MGSLKYLLFIYALWHAIGCVIPPDDYETSRDNSPPFIDWALTVPEPGEPKVLDLAIGDSGEFSVDGAVFDADEDFIYYFWYWRMPELKLLEDEAGYETFVLEGLCQFSEIRKLDEDTGAKLTVHVVVSDHSLKWNSNNKEQPVDTGIDENGNPRPLITRVWVVDLTGNCR